MMFNALLILVDNSNNEFLLLSFNNKRRFALGLNVVPVLKPIKSYFSIVNKVMDRKTNRVTVTESNTASLRRLAPGVLKGPWA